MSVRVVTSTSLVEGEGRRGGDDGERVRPTPVAVVSNDPATVIFPACVGVREREFTPCSFGGRTGKEGASAGGRRVHVLGRESPSCKVFLCCTCARDPRGYAVAKPRAATRIALFNPCLRGRRTGAISHNRDLDRAIIDRDCSSDSCNAIRREYRESFLRDLSVAVARLQPRSDS